MDYIKNVIGIMLLMAMVMPLASAIESIEFDFTQSYIGSGFEISDGTSNATLNLVSRTSAPNSYAVLSVVATDDIGNNTWLNLTCQNSTHNIYLGEYSRWVNYAISDFKLPLKLSNTGNYYLESCDVSVDGDNIILTTYYPLTGDSPISAFTTLNYMEVPDNAMNDIVSGVSNVLSSAFDLMEILLVVTAIILLVFLLVFAWKLIEYFATRVSRKGRFD